MKGRQIMRRFLRRSGVALALVLLLGGRAGGAVLADDQLDLAIKLVGLKPNNPRVAVFRVTNVSPVWAKSFTVTVETVPRAAGDPVVKDLENLDEQGKPVNFVDIEYTLAADCSGQVVKAVVSKAVNYNGDPESNTTNNGFNDKVCPAAGPSAPVGASAAEIDTNRPGLDPVLPEPLRRGPH